MATGNLDLYCHLETLEETNRLVFNFKFIDNSNFKWTNKYLDMKNKSIPHHVFPWFYAPEKACMFISIYTIELITQDSFKVRFTGSAILDEKFLSLAPSALLWKFAFNLLMYTNCADWSNTFVQIMANDRKR